MRTTLLFTIAALFSLGIVMVFNTSSAEVLDRFLEKSTHQALVRQLLFASMGLFLGVWVWKMGYRSFLQLSPYFLGLLTLFLVAVFFPPFGQARNGAHRWIGIGGMTFQPSEFVKYLVIFSFIQWVTSIKTLPTFKEFLKAVGRLCVPIGLVLIEPDNGSTFVMIVSLLPLFFLSKIPFKYWLIPLISLLVVGGAVAWNLPYVKKRIEVYLHPEQDLLGKGHQAHQAKIAAGSGGFLGRGVGESLQKFTYLPEAQNDYIAAIFAEEFGFLGVSILIGLYFLLTLSGMAIALLAKSREGMMMAVGITFLIALQAFLNLGVVSGLLPSKGVNLPFFSQGGTSLIANILGATLLLSIGQDAEKKTNYFQRWRNGRTHLSRTQARS